MNNHNPTIALFATATLALMLAANPALADSWGPAPGAASLDGLTATTANGETVMLAELAGERDGLVIAFVRSADWCPFCKRQLIELSQREADFSSRDLTLVSISYDSPSVLTSFSEEFELTLTLLSDSDSLVIDAFEIRDPSHAAGTPGDGIPLPGIMVFDAKGVLVQKFAEPSYQQRPGIDEVLAAIDARRVSDDA